MGQAADSKEVEHTRTIVPYILLKEITSWRSSRWTIKYSPQEISFFYRKWNKLQKNISVKPSKTRCDSSRFLWQSAPATKDAGKIAGLNVSIINELPQLQWPMASIKNRINTQCLTWWRYWHFNSRNRWRCVVKSTNGDTFLGGDDFDNHLIQFLADEFKRIRVLIPWNKMALQRLKKQQKKRNMSFLQVQKLKSTFLSLPQMLLAKHLNVKITRAKFSNSLKI